VFFGETLNRTSPNVLIMAEVMKFHGGTIELKDNEVVVTLTEPKTGFTDAFLRKILARKED